MAKIYNALTGAEVMSVITSEVERELEHAGIDKKLREEIMSGIRKSMEDAGINSVGVTYPMASWQWTLTIRQVDAEGRPVADTSERNLEAGKAAAGKVVNALHGSSKRFKHKPPSPTEVRLAENLPLPEG